MTSDSIKTEVGSYFISNYPPYSAWNEGGLEDARQVLQSPPADVPLGLYLHIPFCRKRCKFCYFKVFTENTAGDIEQSVSALSREIEGVENFSDAVLEENGRAHLSPEVYKCWEWIEAADFDNVNIDLISGMVGESDDNWQDNIRRTIELAPESVTIYQMELPYNTVYSQDILGERIATPVADWPTKRRWVDEAFAQLEQAGYHVSSAYTMVKHPERVSFSYRDNLWMGSDLLATGIASFGHVSGVHYQNLAQWDDYVGSLLEHDRLPLDRGFKPSQRQLLIREMILQLKRGYLDPAYFQDKFQLDILTEWHSVWQQHQQDGMLTFESDRIQLTRQGLLQADGLLPAFFEPDFQGIRYT